MSNLCAVVDDKINKGTQKGKFLFKGQDRKVRLHSRTTSGRGECTLLQFQLK